MKSAMLKLHVQQQSQKKGGVLPIGAPLQIEDIISYVKLPVDDRTRVLVVLRRQYVYN